MNLRGVEQKCFQRRIDRACRWGYPVDNSLKHSFYTNAALRRDFEYVFRINAERCLHLSSNDIRLSSWQIDLVVQSVCISSEGSTHTCLVEDRYNLQASFLSRVEDR